MWTYESRSFSPRTSLCKVSATNLRLHFLSNVPVPRHHLGVGATCVRRDGAEGGANVYRAFGRVCSIFPVLLFRGFHSNVPPRARFINVWVVEIRTAGGPLKLFSGLSFLGFCIVTDAYSE